MATSENTIIATGRRKSSVARVRLLSGGEGTIVVNGRVFEEYFPRDTMRAKVLRPLLLTERTKAYNVAVTLNGGGIVSQAGAVAHAISRALIKADVALRGTLKKDGLLTRDSRMKERKKYGQKGARKRFQFSKR
jgi:small subunit ribosomal protein S9